MVVNGNKISIIMLSTIMIAAVILQILVFLDPQNNLVTGGVVSGEGFFVKGGLTYFIIVIGIINLLVYRKRRIN